MEQLLWAWFKTCCNGTLSSQLTCTHFFISAGSKLDWSHCGIRQANAFPNTWVEQLIFVIIIWSWSYKHCLKLIMFRNVCWTGTQLYIYNNSYHINISSQNIYILYELYWSLKAGKCLQQWTENFSQSFYNAKVYLSIWLKKLCTKRLQDHCLKEKINVGQSCIVYRKSSSFLHLKV